jgi:hypothetical protein
MDLRAHG